MLFWDERELIGSLDIKIISKAFNAMTKKNPGVWHHTALLYIVKITT